MFRDDFDGAGLDTRVWVPHYVPMWNSRAESAATDEFDALGMQMMVAVFDFPAKGDSHHVPELAVDHVRGT